MVISATAVQGKVAMILNDREVVINRGKEHGVELGTRYKVVGNSRSQGSRYEGDYRDDRAREDSLRNRPPGAGHVHRSNL